MNTGPWLQANLRYSFFDKDALKKYLNFLEEASKARSPATWKGTDLFSFSDEVAPAW